MYSRISLALTAIYWAVAALGAHLADPGPGAWLDFRWEIAFFVYALPATMILWATSGILTKSKRQVAVHTFAMVGITIPVVWAATAFSLFYFLSGSAALDARMRRTNHAELLESSDGPIESAYGQLGVRLRYQVNYPLGLKDREDEAHAEVTDGHNAGFFRVNRSVSPSVVGEYPKGIYTITEEFLPDFFPKDWNAVDILRTDHPLCFAVSANALRQLFLSWPPAKLQVRLYLSNAPLLRETQNAYNLSDIVASAQKLGFTSCDP